MYQWLRHIFSGTPLHQIKIPNSLQYYIMPHFCKPTTATVHYSQFLHRITIYCLRQNQIVNSFNFRKFIKQVRHQR
ncbi:hypothetical protein Hanom_Chr09g00861251 [Helianthus anomalus]